MIEEFVPQDQLHDDFYGQLIVQEIEKLNIFIEQLAEDSILLLLKRLPTAPTITSHKPDSVTSSNLRVGSPQVFSPILPITPEQLPQHSQETVNEPPSTLTVTRRLLRYNNFCGTVDRLNLKNQSTTDLSQTTQFSIASSYSHSPGL